VDIIIRDVEEKDGQYKIYNKDGTGGHWYITKKSAEQISGQIEPRVMQLLADKGINVVELRHLLNKVKRVKIKNNFREILMATFPDEYTDSDYIFFERYTGKEANIYQWAGDWWILEDDNYLITPDCFEELSKQSA
jgi:hypothetical protein